jgi:putative hydrolase of the HAD superfamily
MIQAVAFDLWETLITDSPELSRQQERLRLSRMEAILREGGHQHAAEEIEGAYRRLWQQCHHLYWANDVDIPCRRQIEHFLQELTLDPARLSEAELGALEQAYAHAAVEIPPALVDGALETIDALRSDGLRVGMISNTGRTPGSALRLILERLGLAAKIETMVFSNEHGACKPQASIFGELQRGLGIPFERMLFVGDNPFADVHGAQSCGMRAVLFEPAIRGTAVAPPVDHGLTIVPDGRVRTLPEVVGIVRQLNAGLR